MIGQLDPGFTTEGFWANAAIQVLAAFVGTLGAFIVAWLIYRRTNNEERARFEQALANDRKIFQDTIAHDLQVRREEDATRRRERQEAEREEYKRALVALLGEIMYDLRVIEHNRDQSYVGFPLRVQAFEQAYPVVGMLPTDVGEAVQDVLFRIDLYNALDPSGLGVRSVLMDLEEPLERAATQLARHIREQGFMSDEHAEIPSPD